MKERGHQSQKMCRFVAGSLQRFYLLFILNTGGSKAVFSLLDFL